MGPLVILFLGDFAICSVLRQVLNEPCVLLAFRYVLFGMIASVYVIKQNKKSTIIYLFYLAKGK